MCTSQSSFPHFLGVPPGVSQSSAGNGGGGSEESGGEWDD